MIRNKPCNFQTVHDTQWYHHMFRPPYIILGSFDLPYNNENAHKHHVILCFCLSCVKCFPTEVGKDPEVQIRSLPDWAISTSLRPPQGRIKCIDLQLIQQVGNCLLTHPIDDDYDLAVATIARLWVAESVALIGDNNCLKDTDKDSRGRDLRGKYESEQGCRGGGAAQGAKQPPELAADHLSLCPKPAKKQGKHPKVKLKVTNPYCFRN